MGYGLGQDRPHTFRDAAVLRGGESILTDVPEELNGGLASPLVARLASNLTITGRTLRMFGRPGAVAFFAIWVSHCLCSIKALRAIDTTLGTGSAPAAQYRNCLGLTCNSRAARP
jgi:hypothetical protein